MSDKKPQSSQQQPKKPHQELTPIEQNMAMSVLHSLQLERTLWLVVKEAGGDVVVDEASISALWDLKMERVPDAAPTLMRLRAIELQEPTDGQINKLAGLLAGQPEARTPSALLECGLSVFPPAYMVARLAPLVRCENGMWKAV